MLRGVSGNIDGISQMFRQKGKKPTVSPSAFFILHFLTSRFKRAGNALCQRLDDVAVDALDPKVTGLAGP